MPELQKNGLSRLLTYCCRLSWHVLDSYPATILPGTGGYQSDHRGCPSDDISGCLSVIFLKQRPHPARVRKLRELDAPRPKTSPQSSETEKTGQFWRDAGWRAGNTTLDLSLHASRFSLYVRGVAFGQRLRLYPGRVCLLIRGPFLTRVADWLGEVVFGATLT